MSAAHNSFDFLLNTIPVGHDTGPNMALLKRDGTVVIVGAAEPLTRVNGVAAFACWIADRRPVGNAGEARFLRGAQHHLRHG